MTPIGEDSALPGQYRSRHTFWRSPRLFVALTILFPLTILPIDTNGYIPSQSVDLPIMAKRGRRRIPQSRLVRMIRDEAGWIMPENDCEAVAEFIRTKGITRCPTACVLPTQGWLLRQTGLRWKSTPLRATNCAEHKPLLASDHFKLDGPTVASLV